MITSMISLFLLIHLSLGDEVLFMDPSGRHITTGQKPMIGGTGAVNDAVARLFYLGYIDEDANTSFLTLPRDNLLTRNLMITVTGLHDVSLPSLKETFQMKDQKIEGFHRLVRQIQEVHDTDATIISLSGDHSVAEGIVGGLGTARSESTPSDEDWDLLGKFGLDGEDQMVKELVQELALLKEGDLFPTSAAPEFVFVTLVKLSRFQAGEQKERAAKLVEFCLGKFLKKFETTYANNGIAEVILLQNPQATQMIKGYAAMQQEVRAIRRLQSGSGNNSNSNFTYNEMYTTQIRYWISIALGISAYTFCYYMAFYGNYSADQMLYTSFNAKWDERKMK